MSPEGDLHTRILTGLTKLQEKQLTPTHVFWHQGEADAVFATSSQDYTQHFGAMVNSIREQQVDAPIFNAIATVCGVRDPDANVDHELVRRAQLSLHQQFDNVWLGPRLCENFLITFSNKYRLLMINRSQNKLINNSTFDIIFSRLIDYMLALCHVILKVYLASKQPYFQKCLMILFLKKTL